MTQVDSAWNPLTGPLGLMQAQSADPLTDRVTIEWSDTSVSRSLDIARRERGNQASRELLAGRFNG